MIAPATASTGITALTPMKGASAAVRMMPVPKPPMPPTTAATMPSAATSASACASSSNLAARHGPRLAGAVDGDVGERRLRDLDDFRIRRPALGVYLDIHGDRSVADALDIDEKREQVADLHRLLEDELLYGDGGDAPARQAAGDHAARDVDLRHDPAAEDVTVLVRVRRHRQHAQCRLLSGQFFHLRRSAVVRRGTAQSRCRR